MQNSDEIKRFSEYIEQNYYRMLKHIKESCWFQTFNWSIDWYHTAILSIYRAIENGTLINYNKIDQLLFIAYKNEAIERDTKERRFIPSDMTPYETTLLWEEPEDFWEKERLYDEIVQSVDEYFDEKHKELFHKYLNGYKLTDIPTERKMLEDIRWFLRFKYRTRQKNKGETKSNPNTTEVIQLDLKKRIVKKWKSFKEIEEQLGINKHSIYKAINQKQARFGYYWKYGKRRNGNRK